MGGSDLVSGFSSLCSDDDVGFVVLLAYRHCSRCHDDEVVVVGSMIISSVGYWIGKNCILMRRCLFMTRTHEVRTPYRPDSE